MVQFWEENSIFSSTQHAYRSNHSCTSYWMDLYSKIMSFREGGWKVALLSLDLSSAFNCCSKKILIPKLKRLGFSDNALEIITQFMTNRRVRVKVGETLSSEVILEDSTPEGGISSPSLFQMLVLDFNALCKRIIDKCVALQNSGLKISIGGTDSNEYADDSLLILAAKDDSSLQILINIAYEEAFGYFSSNNLLVNSSKSELLVVGKSPGTKFFVNGIQDSDTMKLIGLRFDNKMNFLPQARYKAQQVAAKLSGLKRLSQWASFSLCLQVATSLLLSKLNHLLEIMGHSHVVQVVLQKSMNHILRIVTKGNNYSSVASMLTQCNLLNIKNQCRYQSCLWFKKCVEKGVGKFTRGLLTSYDQRTRTDAFKLVFVPKLKISEHSFVVQGALIYRELNMSGVLHGSYKEMKNSVKFKILDRFPNGNIM